MNIWININDAKRYKLKLTKVDKLSMLYRLHLFILLTYFLYIFINSIIIILLAVFYEGYITVQSLYERAPGLFLVAKSFDVL
jgi:hypothetical protein